jgi:hypothetical protein
MSGPVFPPPNSFDTEWLSIGVHRVLVHQRDGPPRAAVRRAAMVAAWILEDAWDADSARLVEVFFENRHGNTFYVKIGVTDEEDCVPTESIRVALGALHDGSEISVEVVELKPGPTHQDSYDHTSYVSKTVLGRLDKEVPLA